jgi:hypothetical protein
MSTWSAGFDWVKFVLVCLVGLVEVCKYLVSWAGLGEVCKYLVCWVGLCEVCKVLGLRGLVR